MLPTTKKTIIGILTFQMVQSMEAGHVLSQKNLESFHQKRYIGD